MNGLKQVKTLKNYCRL